MRAEIRLGKRSISTLGKGFFTSSRPSCTTASQSDGPGQMRTSDILAEPIAHGGCAHGRARQPGLPGTTPILTAEGLRTVASLSPGDRIITRSGMDRIGLLYEVAPPQWAVRIDPAALGPDRPDTLLWLCPDQLLRIPGGGLERASRLVDLGLARRAPTDETLWRHAIGLAFDRPRIVYVAGLEVGCSPRD